MSNKVSHDDDHLDFAKIEKEVQSAVVSEEKYWRENDAKIRAVEQRVPTYDDFREIVMAAHLKPLEKGDRISDIGRFTQVWNQLAVGQGSGTETQSGKKDDLDVNGMCMPSSGQIFARTWKHLSKVKEDQKNYLLIVGPERLGNLFKSEITGGLLGEFFDCLQSVKDSEADVVLELLEMFSKTQRFSLSLAFLSKTEKANASDLFKKLKDLCGSENEKNAEKLKEIESMYKL